MSGRPTEWTVALCASVLLHVGVGATAARSVVAHTPAPPVAVAAARDRWAGATMDVDVAPGPEREPATREAEPTSRTAPRPRRERPVPGVPKAPVAEDPAEALARRILDYHPPSGGPSDASSPAKGAALPGAAPAPTGGEEESGGRRSLAVAFTRAFPVANTGDPLWGQLPLGDAGAIVFALLLDGDGAVVDMEEEKRPPAPPVLRRCVERVLLVLRSGRFTTGTAGATRLTLRLEVTLSARPMESGPLALGFEPPRPGKAGRAYFQLPSGRFVDARVGIERAI